jgi:hypothetical protein
LNASSGSSGELNATMPLSGLSSQFIETELMRFAATNPLFRSTDFSANPYLKNLSGFLTASHVNIFNHYVCLHHTINFIG